MSGCICTCTTGYTGATCNQCATNYEGYPTCQPVPCYTHCDCSDHATSVSGNVVTGCTCACAAGFAGATCNECAPNFENYPSCVESTCSIADNCHGHATAVSGTPATHCDCTCAAGFSGEHCSMCATGFENYPTCSAIQCTMSDCNNHASAVSGTVFVGCQCTCLAGFAGEQCERCDSHHDSYPACSETLCTSRNDCSNHAATVSGTLVSGCTCGCATGYTGAKCDRCAENYEDYPVCTLVQCTASRNCNSHAWNATGDVLTGCTCNCFTGYTGSSCESCALNYQGYPTCLPIVCTIAADCSNYTTAVSGTRVTGCKCTCRTGYTDATCDACARHYDGYPSCQAIVCSKSANCNDHATAVSGYLVSGCACACAVGYTGPACNVCSPAYEGYPTCTPIMCITHNDCNDHATSVSGNLVTGCTCTCVEGYTGSRCERCAPNYEGYPTCVETACSIADNCHGLATAVSGTPATHCDCTCAAGFGGEHCNMCAAGFENYPTCSAIQCTMSDCNNHASAVSGTVFVGCQCTCLAGFTGELCERCDSKYENFPACSAIACSSRCDCSNHAATVSGTLVSGCTCGCAAGYAGAKCSRCATNYTNYPSCTMTTCDTCKDCNSHADSTTGNQATGCTCNCYTGYAGPACEACAANYQGYPTCLPIPCTVTADCSNHATAVVGDHVTKCRCTCRVGFAGAKCDRCDAQYTGYPSCAPIPCSRVTDCNNHASAVSGTLVTGCRCTCAAGYTGTACDLCAAGYQGYPNCTATPCTVEGNCNGHATAVRGTLVSGCVCTCNTNYAGTTCGACSANYASYPVCSAISCTIENDCNDHATSVNGTIAAGCTCSCILGYAGAKCGSCASNYYNYPYCSPSVAGARFHKLNAELPPQPRA